MNEHLGRFTAHAISFRVSPRLPTQTGDVVICSPWYHPTIQAVVKRAKRIEASKGCMGAREPGRSRNSGSMRAVPGKAKLPSCAIQYSEHVSTAEWRSCLCHSNQRETAPKSGPTSSV